MEVEKTYQVSYLMKPAAWDKHELPSLLNDFEPLGLICTRKTKGHQEGFEQQPVVNVNL